MAQKYLPIKEKMLNSKQAEVNPVQSEKKQSKLGCPRAVPQGKNPRSHCGSPIHKRGMCRYHYYKWVKRNPFAV